jgi:S-adenosylmethionine:tRNA ribosyltransferase-isomerase
MLNTFETKLKPFDYSFPSELIAQEPAHPRDSARLLVVGKSNTNFQEDIFKNLGKYLPKNSVLVFNQTKVVPARLDVEKESGGKAEILYIDHNKEFVKVLSNRFLPEKSTIILLSDRSKLLRFKIERIQKPFYFLKPNFPISNIKNILNKFGKTPLPPYIKNSQLTEKQRRKEYQTVFAKEGLSVAAPTASLHFTKQLINKLKKQGIEVKYVTLNVGMGTFASLTEEQLKTGQLHSEFYSIDKKTAAELNKLKQQGKKIIAVGTTAVRTLESASKKQKLEVLQGDTKLFIRPGYKFNFVDGLITNFHVPKSSLLMLVSALAERNKILSAYKYAIKNKFRLFSFGDGMLILPKK